MINVYKQPESANVYANLFIQEIPGNVENVCLLFIGHLETVYNILAAKPSVNFTVIDGRDTIDALPYIYNESNLKESITFEDSWCEDNEAFIEGLQTIFNNMAFDLIIANPPYGKIGANITKTIIDNIDYDEYINLLPANDYNRNTTKDLYKYVDLDSMTPINKGFADAFVTTYMAKITKKQHRYISWEDFQIESFIDNSLTKYFYSNLTKTHTAIDSGRRPHFHMLTTENNNNTVLLGIRDMANKHLSYSKTCDTYLWNVDKSVDVDKLKSNIGKTGSPNTQTSHYFITFNTAVEKDNFVNFMYSVDGFRFFSKVFTALNTDSMIALSRFLPKVDWTRSWTVEEILKEYGYTQKEIEEVINDLVNYKGMED